MSNLIYWPRYIEDAASFIFFQWLQGIELRLQQRRWHEVSRPVLHPFIQHIKVTVYVYKRHAWAVLPNQIPVLSLQSTAPHHRTFRPLRQPLTNLF